MASWWIEYVTQPGGSEAVPHVVSSASQPQATGNVEWVFGPYSSQAAAQQAANTGPPSGNPVSAQGGITPVGGGSGSLTGAATSAISQAFLGPLFQGNIWLRAAEVVIGVILLGIGVNALFKGKPLQVVTNTAGAVGRVVP